MRGSPNILTLAALALLTATGASAAPSGAVSGTAHEGGLGPAAAPALSGGLATPGVAPGGPTASGLTSPATSSLATPGPAIAGPSVPGTVGNAGEAGASGMPRP